MKLKLSIVFFLASFYVHAQDTSKIEYWTPQPPKPKIAKPTTPHDKFMDLKRVFYGVNFSLLLGTYTFVDASPFVGYKITDKIAAGVGATYQYYLAYQIAYNVYGDRVFGRYYFKPNFFCHAEYEVLSLEASINPPERVNLASVLAGIGYIRRFSENAGISTMILYNCTPSLYTTYEYPIPIVIRIGVIFGL